MFVCFVKQHICDACAIYFFQFAVLVYGGPCTFISYPSFLLSSIVLLRQLRLSLVLSVLRQNALEFYVVPNFVALRLMMMMMMIG